MKKFAKHLGMTFLLTSTVLLWGTALGFSNGEILASAFALVILQWAYND